MKEEKIIIIILVMVVGLLLINIGISWNSYNLTDIEEEQKLFVESMVYNEIDYNCNHITKDFNDLIKDKHDLDLLTISGSNPCNGSSPCYSHIMSCIPFDAQSGLNVERFENYKIIE